MKETTWVVNLRVAHFETKDQARELAEALNDAFWATPLSEHRDGGVRILYRDMYIPDPQTGFPTEGTMRSQASPDDGATWIDQEPVTMEGLIRD